VKVVGLALMQGSIFSTINPKQINEEPYRRWSISAMSAATSGPPMKSCFDVHGQSMAANETETNTAVGDELWACRDSIGAKQLWNRHPTYVHTELAIAGDHEECDGP
jgi:hypothetical protein